MYLDLYKYRDAEAVLSFCLPVDDDYNLQIDEDLDDNGNKNNLQVIMMTRMIVVSDDDDDDDEKNDDCVRL